MGLLSQFHKRIRIFWRDNWFVFLLWFVLLLAYISPNTGVNISKQFPVKLLLTMSLFFCIGLNLPGETLLNSLCNWKFHLAVQGYIFIFYPLLFWFILAPIRHLLAEEVLLGLAVLSVLPTSGSSCVLFSGESGGNQTLAVVNSVLATILGATCTPLLVNLIYIWFFPHLLSAGDPEEVNSLISLFRGLSGKVFLPLLFGHWLRRLALNWIKLQRRKISIINNLAIVFIVFFSFSEAVMQENFIATLKNSPLPFIFLFLVYPILVLLANWFGRLFGLARADRITFTFVGSQKSIAMGVPLISSIFGSEAGLVLFPLLFYHPWQLMVASFVRMKYLRPLR